MLGLRVRHLLRDHESTRMRVALDVLELISASLLVILKVSFLLAPHTDHEQSWFRGVRTFDTLRLFLRVLDSRRPSVNMIVVESIVVWRWCSVLYPLRVIFTYV